MITDAIFTLNDRKGSSRDAIWKYISHHQKYQESIRDKKMFLTQLRRLSAGNDFFEKSKDSHQRFKLTLKFKGRLTNFVKKGHELHLAQKQAMTTKTINPKKSATKLKKAKMTKSTKGLAKLSKTKAAQNKDKKTKDRKQSTKKDTKAA